MWHSISFKLIDSSLFESTIVSIKNIPPIIVESSPDYGSAILSGLATLIGGAIPALIALKAIKANKEQMLRQQIIINRQNFIDNLRMKMSMFTSDSGIMLIHIQRELAGNDCSLENAPEEVYAKILELAHQIERQHNYIQLLIGSNENFAESLKIMKYISDSFFDPKANVDKIEIYKQIELLLQRTEEGIKKEEDVFFVN
ncbi:hypothetical protein FDX24_10085 [Citrobacter sp. wls716]|uniref:hypothetical protein n=1 Tax=Citrobacter sp. wls716 TaxID=2576420 RepID=UPI0010C946EB|nr:hypothetical protein [Citrobacter sp. wls716]TKU40664.1 hypothetical protein FDX24_10085 [Citrobacter sp. wls716]